MSIDVPALDENEKKGEEYPDNEFVMFDSDSDEEDEYDDRYAVYSFFFFVCDITLLIHFHDLEKVFVVSKEQS